MEILRHPSPNFTARRGGARPDLIVLHYTAMPSAEAARDRLCDPAAEVSAHYLIARDGRCLQLVDEEMRAWHAGAGYWQGSRDVNSRSIGIELDNDGVSPFSEVQMSVLETLLAGLMERWGIAAEGVIAHSDSAPGRKTDPGPRFDWRRLAQQGLATWPDRLPQRDGAVDPAAFAVAAHSAGYDPELAPETILAALRLRLRPWAWGPLDAEDMALAEALAGIDRGAVRA